MHSFIQDLRFGARMLRKNPGFALAAILTLALGIGANTAIFTITSSVLLRALPYHDPQQLINLDWQSKDGQSHCCSLNKYDLVHDRSKSFSGVVAAANDNFNLTGHGEPLQVSSGRVTPDFFDVLGIKPQIGRFFVPEEGQAAGKPVIVISDSFWHTRFGGDRGIVGQTVTLDGTPHTIIGVLPANVQFPFLTSADVWTPRYFEHSLFTTQRLRMGVGYLSIILRLRPDVSRERAAAELSLLDQQFQKENPGAPDAQPDLAVMLTGLQDSVVGDIRPKLLFLTGAVVLVLLIACANVASLLLSRALSRRKEISVRAALGARRSVLVRQLLTESVLLALLGGVAGLGLCWAATKYLSNLGDTNLNSIPVTMDTSVFLFMVAISVLTGIAFGIFPALRLSRTNVNTTLRDEGRGSTGNRSKMQLHGLLVIGQVALSLTLLIGAGLLVRSFTALLRVDPGFDPQNVLTMNVSIPASKYSDAQKQIAFFDELMRRTSALPGVRSAAISAALPLSWKRITPVLPEGQPDVPLPQRPFLGIEAISPQWFQTMRVPILMGREFSEADNAQAPKVIIVNQSFARRYWPHENPIAKHVVIGRGPAPSEVVGVAGDVKNHGLAQDAQPQIYLPFPQLAWGNMNLIVRTAADPHTMISAIRAQVAAGDVEQPVTNIQTISELMDASLAQPRMMLLRLGVFSAVALIVAIVGIYGVMAYAVSQRRQEMGIRLALGASRADIVRMVVRYGFRLAAIGVAIGVLLSMALSWILASMLSGILYHVSARDTATFILAPLLFLAISLLATYIPARRATQVDPNEAVRGL